MHVVTNQIQVVLFANILVEMSLGTDQFKLKRLLQYQKY